MRVASCFACACVVLAAAPTAPAQTKFSGKVQCAKADPSYTVPVADRANHVMSLGRSKCTWTQGEIAGNRLTDEEDTFVSDISGNTSRDRGYGVGTLVNGDRYFVRFETTTTMKDNVPVSGKCTWAFTGGTATLKGIKGKGTCTGTFNPDGTGAWDIAGDYLIPMSRSGK